MTTRIAKFASVVAVTLAAMFVAGPAPREALAGGGACYVAPAEREATGDLVRLSTNCFAPTVLRVEAGAEVTFRNDDQMTHHIAGVAMAWGTEPGPMLGTGGERKFTFAEAGTYPYSCYIHVGMSGVIVVGDGVTAGSATSVRSSVVQAPAGAPAARLAQAAPAVPEPAPAPGAEASANTAEEEDSSAPLFAVLGALAGGAVVAVGFGMRGMRRER